MNQEIEIEFKTLLTRDKFEEIKKELLFPAIPICQTNYYFETENFSFKQQHSALRIREKDGSYTLTLKQPHPKGILETHDKLTTLEFTSWTEGFPIMKEHTGKKITEMEIPIDSIQYYGSLKTERYSFVEDQIIYVLDKSYYHNKVDYELEIESRTFTSGKDAFTKLLRQLSIPKQAPITKIHRFFNAIGKI